MLQSAAYFMPGTDSMIRDMNKMNEITVASKPRQAWYTPHVEVNQGLNSLVIVDSGCRQKAGLCNFCFVIRFDNCWNRRAVRLYVHVQSDYSVGIEWFKWEVSRSV